MTEKTKTITKINWKEELTNWEEEYMQMRECDPGPFLTDTEIDILQSDVLKSNEGMIFGRMYADWKKRKGLPS